MPFALLRWRRSSFLRATEGGARGVYGRIRTERPAVDAEKLNRRLHVLCSSASDDSVCMTLLSQTTPDKYPQRHHLFVTAHGRLFLSASAAPLLCLLILLSACGHDDPAKIMEARPPNSIYHYGEKITFGNEGKARGFTRGGWSDSEGTFAWTNGVAASLAVQIPEPAGGSVNLAIRMEAFMRAPDLLSQPVDVVVNGEKLGQWEVTGRKIYAARIPAKFVAKPDSVLFIDLYIPKASTPASLTSGGDTRRLGLCVFDFSLAETGDMDSLKPADRAQPGALTKP